MRDRAKNKVPVELLNDSDYRVSENGTEKFASAAEAVLSRHARGDIFISDITLGASVTSYSFDLPTPNAASRIRLALPDIESELGTSIRFISDGIGGTLEVPVDDAETVALKEIIESAEFAKDRSQPVFAVGVSAGGRYMVHDLEKHPHLIVGGVSESGKSVFLHSVIISLIYKQSPDELRFILADTGADRSDFSAYDGIPYLSGTVTDADGLVSALNELRAEAERRYGIMTERGFDTLRAYNMSTEVVLGKAEKFSRTVMIIDDISDALGDAVKKHAITESIGAITGLPDVGIHLIISTSRPSPDMLTAGLKGGIGSRISFRTANRIDSRNILGCDGAEKLAGKGDMLVATDGKILRCQGAYVSEGEINAVVEWVKENVFVRRALDMPNGNRETAGVGASDVAVNDPLLEAAAKHVLTRGRASVCDLARGLNIDFDRAARLFDAMQKIGFIKSEVAITQSRFDEVFGQKRK